MLQNDLVLEIEEKKELYDYQKGDIDAIFERIDNGPNCHHLLYQYVQKWHRYLLFGNRKALSFLLFLGLDRFATCDFL